MNDPVRWRVGRYVISEPMTLATDYALCLVSGYFGLQLALWGCIRHSTPVLLWSAAHFAVALGAATGGTYHGVLPMLSQRTASRLWTVTVYLVGIGNACLATAAVLAGTEGWLRTTLSSLILIQLIIYLVWMWSRDDFRWVMYDSIITLALVGTLQTYGLMAHGSPSAPWILGGIGIAVVGAGVQRFGWGPGRYFNHNDLFHVIQIASMYLLYRGGLLLTEVSQ